MCRPTGTADPSGIRCIPEAAVWRGWGRSLDYVLPAASLPSICAPDSQKKTSEDCVLPPQASSTKVS
eukprot:9548-Pyramimonas_sp.AAC.1